FTVVELRERFFVARELEISRRPRTARDPRLNEIEPRSCVRQRSLGDPPQEPRAEPIEVGGSNLADDDGSGSFSLRFGGREPGVGRGNRGSRAAEVVEPTLE